MTRDKKITFRVSELELKLIKINGSIEGFKKPSAFIRFVLGLPIKLKK